MKEQTNKQKKERTNKGSKKERKKERRERRKNTLDRSRLPSEAASVSASGVNGT